MFSLLRPSLLIAASLPAAAQAQQGGAVVERIALAMGTSLRMEVCAEDRGAALRASEAALQAVEAVEQRLSSWLEGSELSQLVRARVGEAFPASAELCADLRRASYWAGISRGAFDIRGVDRSSAGEISLEERVVRERVQQTRATATKLVKCVHSGGRHNIRTALHGGHTMLHVGRAVIHIERLQSNAHVDTRHNTWIVLHQLVELG